MISSLALRLIVATVAIGAVTTMYFSWATHQQRIGEDRATAIFNKQIEELQQKARVKLKEQNNLVLLAQKDLADFKNAQELKDATNKSTVASLNRRLRDLANAGSGRLRDPNADEICRERSDPGPDTSFAGTSNSDNDAPKAGGLLSTALSELLQSVGEEADAINVAYISCRADSQALRERLQLLATQQRKAVEAQ
jgi:hypothetical protein